MSITSGVGLISGIDTASLIDQLIALESRPKLLMQSRIATLTSQQASLLDINGRLLTLKNLAAGLRKDSVFSAATAISSNESILAATASNATPGVYQLTVKQLVSTSQKLSRGFTDRDATPIGMTSLSFELGQGKISRDTDLADLNGGQGVRRGRIVITDTAQNQATIDLSTATTIGEVLDAINGNTDVEVTATVQGDRLVLTDTAGGPPRQELTITDAPGDFTATDLGIAAVDGGPGDADGNDDEVLTGARINFIGGGTALSALNDGAGVYLTNANPDVTITTRDGTRTFEVDFGRRDNPITGATLLEDLNDGDGVTIDNDADEPDIRIVAKDGTEHEIDLTGLTTVQQVIDTIDSATGGDVTLSIDAGGDRFVVTDNSGGGELLKVLGAGPNGEQTAEDLGILNEAGEASASFTGSTIENADHTPQARTIQEILDRINNAEDTLGIANGGHIVASVADDGVSIRITDTAGGGGNLVVAATATNPYAARDLGIEADVSADTIDGTRLIAGLNSMLVASLNGGSGLGGATTLAISDRDGNGDTFTIDENGSISDIIAQINASDDIEVTASLNEAGNGLLITDDTGSTDSNLIITGSAASALHIDTGAPGVAASSFRGANMQRRYVAEGTSLDALNYGRGIGTGSFRITDSDGQQDVVTIGPSVTSVYGVISTINAQISPNTNILARVNDTGDGILIENVNGTGTIRIESVSGTTARDLGILGQADGGAAIDGSYEKTIEVNATDTLQEIVSAINDAGIPVTASVLNTGSGAARYRISLTSGLGGKPGELIVDAGGFDLGLTTTSTARNAKVFFGADDPADAVVIERSSNQLTNVIDGVTIDLVSADPATPVTVTVNRNIPAITGSISALVDAFNGVMERIDELDFFDVETETRGPLLGHPTPRAVKTALLGVVNGTAVGLDTRYSRLSHVGITVGNGGRLEFDAARFQQAYEDDAEAVEQLFTAFDVDASSTEEIAPGVTIVGGSESVNAMGFGDLLDRRLERLTSSIDGTVTTAADAIQDQIDLAGARIERLDLRLESKRALLERQFAAMELALARLQDQSNALLSLAANIAASQAAAATAR